MISALATDLYQLTMIDSYIAEWGVEAAQKKRATFDLFVRELPVARPASADPGEWIEEKWKYLVACGVDEAIESLIAVRFTDDDLAFLRSLHILRDETIEYLSTFQFRGDVRAVCEGEIVFAGEPLVEVSGSLLETQFAETLLLTTINYQTLIASKASRIVDAAQGVPVFEFGLRRAPGPEAGIRASRAAYIAGVARTSNVEAGRRYGIPVDGTHAHSYVLAHETELQAFRGWAGRESRTWLVDTCGVAHGVQQAIRAAKEGARVDAVRIDSGPLAENVVRARGLLDGAGLHSVKIIVSGDLNEWKIAGLLVRKNPTDPVLVDGFGVGTDLVTARPEAALGGVYKLVEVDDRPVAKSSQGKRTTPGRKQVWRYLIENGSWRDVVQAQDNDMPWTRLPGPYAADDSHRNVTVHRPLLLDRVREGTILQPASGTEEARAYRAKVLWLLRQSINVGYPVSISERIRLDCELARTSRAEAERLESAAMAAEKEM